MDEQRRVLVPCAPATARTLFREHLPSGFVHAQELAAELGEDCRFPDPGAPVRMKPEVEPSPTTPSVRDMPAEACPGGEVYDLGNLSADEIHGVRSLLRPRLPSQVSRRAWATARLPGA